MIKDKKILLVGQTPPPYGGQAIMIQRTLNFYYNDVQLYHVRMAFSKDMDEVGKFKFKKILELMRIILNIYITRIRYKTKFLYYFPAGPNMVPVIRDMVILISVRWLFEKTIFHFQAGGLSEIYPRLSQAMRLLFRKAYYYPDIAIRLSPLPPVDSRAIKAKREYIVPNCVPDNAGVYLDGNGKSKNGSTCPRILFVGVISESKGVTILLEACKYLNEKGILFQLDLIGKFESADFEKELLKFIQRNNLNNQIRFKGVLLGEEKWNAYTEADIFCFPTFAEFENFSLVVLEAMSFELPIITTNWRSLPFVVDDTCSFIVPIRDSNAVARALEKLIHNPTLRNKMGKNGRNRFLENFSMERYYENMNRLFTSV